MELATGMVLELYQAQKELNGAEMGVLADFIRGLAILVQDDPEVIAMVGLTGDGKSHVAKKLAMERGAMLICSDAIRVALKKAGCTYDAVNIIAEKLLIAVLTRGGSAVMDSDHVAPGKRWRLRRLVKKFHTEVEFVFVKTLPEIASLRIGLADYTDSIYGRAIVGEHGLHGTELKKSEREKHRPWYFKKNGEPRTFAFPHTVLKNWSE